MSPPIPFHGSALSTRISSSGSSSSSISNISNSNNSRHKLGNSFDLPLEPTVEEEIVEDCPICLETMSPSDQVHALQCEHQCGYNFCKNCISSLINSSKDDYMEASDGSNQVKVWLHCPNCRSDLSGSIRDTLLLRRADSMIRRKSAGETLSESDRHVEKALQSSSRVRNALEGARERETEFFCLNLDSSNASSGSSYHDDEEWGVEADFIRGVHESFHCPSSPTPHFKPTLEIDRTLFSVQDRSRPDDQLKLLTKLLTSGDIPQLVKAARMMRGGGGGESASSSGSSPYQIARRTSRRGSSFRSSRSMRLSLRSSIRSSGVSPSDSISNLVMELEQAKEKANKKVNTGFAALLEIEREADFLRNYPLPVRMPKCIVLNLGKSTNKKNKMDSFPLKFCNDRWDGTVLDAFCKINVALFHSVFKHSTSHPGVRKILNSDGPVRIDVEKPRVLVASVQGDCSRQGVMKGDVVTHVNGKLFSGDAKALMTCIESLDCAVLELTLNAEPSIAEALMLRSLAAEDVDE